MHWLKNNLIFIIILSLVLILCGCHIEHRDYKDIYKIDVSDIYNMKEEKYYIFFYKDTCPYCDDVYEIVNEYLENNDLNDNTKLYVCDLSNKYRRVYYMEYENGTATFVTINDKIIEIDGIKDYSETDGIIDFVFPDNSKGKIAINESKITIKDKNIKTIEILYEEILSSDIKRAYNGVDGQGVEGKFYVNGVKDIKDLCIATVPSIILIENKESSFVTSGRSKVLDFFENLLNK